VGERDPKMIRLLLEHRADPRRRDADGRTALDYARSSGDPALIDLLSAPLGSSSR
jgi:ankyrin repeat protein